MYQKSLIVRTKLAPPRPHKYNLHRPRLTSSLLGAESHRLTIVQAGTGYGKSTALATFAQNTKPVIWYHLAAEDADPFVFLSHLLYALSSTWQSLSEVPLAQLEEWERNRSASLWTNVVDSLVSALADIVDRPSFVILDDAHLLNKSAVTMRILDRFIGRAPQDLHPILATRYPLDLPTLVTWRVRGQLLEVGQSELAFTEGEITDLFEEQYGMHLSVEQVSVLARRVEGWPITLPLVWQSLLPESESSVSEALGRISGATGELFAYLAHEVLEQQPADIKDFLPATCVLRQLTATTCDQLRAANDSAQILRYLSDNGLFVVDLGDGHSRYHNLFRDLMRHQLPEDQANDAHFRAARIYQQDEQFEEAIYHYLSAAAYDQAARVLEQIGRQMMRTGRLDTLEGWIGTLPPESLAEHPSLLVCLGDVARLHSRFDEALGWYQQAEERSRVLGDGPGTGQALRGQARVYLDTVDASQAERLLQEALRLADGQEDRESRARLLDLLAENLINQGRFREAERYQDLARQLRQEGPGEADLPVRLLLRTGQLDQARRLLEKQLDEERREPVLRPRAHRETLLLLSLILAFQGERERAYLCAIDGTERGRALDSPFVTAVGYMRQGHAWLLDKNEGGYNEARRCFQQAIEMSETLDVPRLKIEANWGLCQAYGFGGDLEAAEEAAGTGIAMALAVGDEWIEASLRLVLGASYCLAGRCLDATEWLAQAGSAFRECGDTYGETVTRLWQCLVWQDTGDTTRLTRDVFDLLQQVKTHRYPYLFTHRTLLGPPEPRLLVPLLLFARSAEQVAGHADQLLTELGLQQLQTHPGYQLRLRTLGAFSAHRGARAIKREEWKRKKALQLFQLLLTYRGQMLEREQITDLLWIDLEPNVAQRDFKIAYSALCYVLEPDRDRNAPSAFFVRDGSSYGLRPEADLWLDVAQFDELVVQGDQLFDRDVEAALPFYREALSLYRGEYLQEHPYQEWCSEERERLHSLFLRCADRLARTLSAQNAWEETIAVCQAILSHDDCWEQAYRLMMTAYYRLGNRTQALRTYKRCAECLETELSVEPAAATVRLYEAIVRDTQSNEATRVDPPKDF